MFDFGFLYRLFLFYKKDLRQLTWIDTLTPIIVPQKVDKSRMANWDIVLVAKEVKTKRGRSRLSLYFTLNV